MTNNTAQAMLSDTEREAYEERAGIAEFCGGISREEAEKLAREEVEAQRA